MTVKPKSPTFKFGPAEEAALAKFANDLVRGAPSFHEKLGTLLGSLRPGLKKKISASFLAKKDR